jgi:DNA-directed RNA polymerase II subunit RPB1
MEYFSEKVEGIKFSVLSPDEIRRMSVVSITSTDLYENNLPKFFGLFDPKMGPYDKNFKCNTCRQSYMECPGHFGHIELAEPVYNIHFMNILKKLLSCVCYTCSNLLFDKTNETKLRLLNKKNRQKKFQYIFTNLVKKCMHCGRLQPKFTKEGMYMFIALNQKTKNKVTKMKLNAKKCLEILKRISDEDTKLLGFIDNKPEWLICEVLPVAPPCIRPSVKHSINLRSEDDLTYKLLDIVKANNQLNEKYKKNDLKCIEDYIDYLQYHVTTLIDNDIRGVPQAQHRNGRVLKGYKQRIKGKEGRIRGNLMGKRVNFSGRSVISPDPYLRIDQIGVPVKMAKILIIKEKVNSYNIKRLQTYVDNGPDNFPGAKYIIKEVGGKNNIEMRDIKYLREHNKILEVGMEVGRHLMDGDIVLFNRQPSLHKMSMMSHIVKIIPTKSFRFNPNVCNPYNADFDGDEMNIFIPISTYTSVELRKMVHVPTQIITPQSNKPVIGAIMDTVVGASHITMDGVNITFNEVTDILGNIDSYSGNFNLRPVEVKNGECYYSGRDVMSMILPKINYHKGAEKKEDVVQIEKGKWLNGMAKKDVIGTSSGSLIHIIANDIGVYAAANFLNELQRIANTHLLNTGFSVSLGDCISTKEERDYIHKILAKAKAEVRSFINLTHARAKTSKTIQLRDEYENKIFGTLNKARDDAGKFAKEKLDKMNGLNFMVTTGSKGNYINICQIAAAVGQQSIADKMGQGRVPFGLEFRTTPHFTKFDDGPEGRGFVSHS